MTDGYQELRDLLRQVRRRWRALTALRAGARALSGAAVVVAAGLVAWWVVRPHDLALVALVGPTLAAALAALAWGLRPVARAPSDRQLARFVEERCPEFEDGLVTAVAAETASPLHASPLFESLLREAATRVRALSIDRVVDRAVLRTAAVGAVLAAIAFAAVMVPFSRPTAQAGAVAAMYLFPSRVSLLVAPGDARIRAGESFTIAARLPGDRSGLVPAIDVVSGGRTRTGPMAPAPQGFTFQAGVPRESFTYRVRAGAIVSPDYQVTVLHAPRVARIDLHYDYPASLGLAPRVEEDGGDIYAPVGTTVRLVVVTDKPVTAAALRLADGTSVPLVGRGAGLEAGLTVGDDGSYRVALADADGLENSGDTEYFIRTLDDRPPDVRVLKPAGDRQVTPIEEVVVEARADDDYGLASFELVYAIRGGPERVVPLRGLSRGAPQGPRGALTASGTHTLYLEELGVAPGDFVTYYARARDIGGGRRSSEARSDIFFLEVKPFEEEFVAAQSQTMSSVRSGTPIDDLAQAQKEIIVATWKLDRRARPAGGRSEPDIRAVARAQGELRTRAREAAGQMATSGGSGRARRPRGASSAPDENDGALVAKAVEAMALAEAQLDRLNTSAALPHEMTALNELLKAQAEIRRRQVQRQQARGGGSASNRQQQDLSTLFDRELRKAQTTNYEQPTSTETESRRDRNDALEKIRELARRQGQLNDEQRALAEQREQTDLEEMKRQLERLTREQSELRRQAEELAQQIQWQRGDRTESDPSRQGQSSSGQSPGQPQAGGRSASGQSPRDASGARGGPSPSGQDTRALREASEAMGGAAGDLRRQDARQASARGARALEKLREMEQQLRGAQPDDRRRALGDLHLESRQLADAERQLADAARRTAGQGPKADEAARRLSAEQERLAERADRLRDQVRQLQAGARRGGRSDRREPGGESRSPKAAEAERTALAQAARELEDARLGDRMRESARSLRESGAAGRVAREGETGQAMARTLDRVADRLGAAAGQDAETRRLSEQLAQARDVRERLAEIDRRMNELARAGQPGAGGRPSAGEGRSPGRASPTGREGPQGAAGQQGGGTGGRGGDVARMQRELAERMRETRERLGQLRRNDSDGQALRDLEGLNPGLSAPGTEAFKQDFAQWESLKPQLARALEQVEASAAAKLRRRDAQDRLHGGGSDAVPDAYRPLVDRYYRALAGRRNQKPETRN